MRTFAKATMPEQGFRFVPAELLEAAEFTLLSLALWALLGYLLVAAIRKLRLSSPLPMALAVLTVLSPLWLAVLLFVIKFPWGIVTNPNWTTDFLLIPLTQAICPKGMFFLAVVFSVYAVWKLGKGPRSVLAVQEAGLGIYASLVAVRQMMELQPNIFKCAVFFNVPTFLIFLILLCKIIRWACRSLDGKRRDFAVASMMAAEAGMLFLLFFPKPGLLPTRLTTEYGSFYTRRDVAILFPQIISFMKSHTRNGKDILVLPEPPSLYVFAGMDAPSRWYSLVPGYVAPEQEQEFINDLASNQVRYVLIADRSFTEYGVWGFINHGYNPMIYRWIMANYVKVGQFGPLADAPYPPFIVWVFEKKGPVAAN